MGCGGSKDTGPKFEDIVLGTPTPVDASLTVDGIISKQGQMVVIKAPAMSKKSEFTDKATGEVLFSTAVISMMNSEGAVLRADGTRFAVLFGKMTGITTKELSIARPGKPAFQGQPASDKPASDAKDVPVYPFATISSKEMGGSTCTYSIVDASGAAKELYKGKRDFGIKEKYLISTMDDVPCAKIVNTNMMGTEMEAELAPGVDICAIMAMCYALSPGGSAGGALAGAGVI